MTDISNRAPEPTESSAPEHDVTIAVDEIPSPKLDGAVTSALLVVAVLILVESFRLGVGELSRPGPGFMSAICAAGMIVALAAGLVIAVRRHMREQNADASDVTGNPDRDVTPRSWFGRWRASGGFVVVTIFAIICAYTLLIPLIGYSVSTVLAVMALLTLQGWRGWKAVIASVCIAAVSAGVFMFLLGAPLPRLFGIA